jgi:hypothetical protein
MKEMVEEVPYIYRESAWEVCEKTMGITAFAGGFGVLGLGSQWFFIKNMTALPL